MADWQEMGTAPRNGAAVLLYCPGADHRLFDAKLPDVFVGVWLEGAWHGGGEWCSDMGSVDPDGAFWPEPLRPTHWQPVPAPPGSKPCVILV